jgi:hypothetical protein
MRLASSQHSSAILSSSSDQRMYFAAAKLSPSPVQSATYAARHAGHFGVSTHRPTESAPAATSQMLRDLERGEG